MGKGLGQATIAVDLAKAQPARVRGQHVAAEEAGDLPLAVQRDVDQKIDRQQRTVVRICSCVGLPSSTPQVLRG